MWVCGGRIAGSCDARNSERGPHVVLPGLRCRNDAEQLPRDPKSPGPHAQRTALHERPVHRERILEFCGTERLDRSERGSPRRHQSTGSERDLAEQWLSRIGSGPDPNPGQRRHRSRRRSSRARRNRSRPAGAGRRRRHLHPLLEHNHRHKWESRSACARHGQSWQPRGRLHRRHGRQRGRRRRVARHREQQPAKPPVLSCEQSAKPLVLCRARRRVFLGRG